MDEMKLGVEHFNAGRFLEARRSFEAARARGERGPELRGFMAHTLDSLGLQEEALLAFVSLIEDFPRHLPSYSGLASLVLRRGPFDRGSRALRRVLALKPRDARVRRELVGVLKACSSALYAAGDLTRAETVQSRLMALEPAEAEHRARLGELIRMRAQTHQTAREYGAAEEALRGALALTPDDPDARRQLSDLLRLRAHEQSLSRRPESAERSLRKALSVAPGDGKSRRNLGELLRRRGKAHQSAGRLAAAEKVLREAMRLQPNDEKARHKLLELLRRRARAALAQGDSVSAERILRRAVAVDPRDKESRGRLLDLMREKARVHLRAGAPAPAERALRRALAFEPRDNEARRRLVELLRARFERSLSSNNAAAANRALRAALAFSRDQEARRRLADLLRARGLAELFARRLARAERFFRAVLVCDASDTAACMSLASVMSAAGRPSEEKAWLLRVVRRARDRNAAGDAFKALMKLRRYKEAFAAAERILDGSPALPDIRCFWDPWDWDERVTREELLSELAALERGLGPNPRGPWIHYYRGALNGPLGLPHFERLAAFPAKRYGWMYFKAGLTALTESKFNTAASWLKIALASEPADWRAHCFLAEAYLCLQKPKAAFTEMDRAARAAPKHEAGQVLAWRGAIELWLGRYKRALGLLDRAAALGAQCAHCWKGAALLKLGKPSEALAELDRTLSLYPLDFEAYVWRGEAKRELGRFREALADLEPRAVKGSSRTTPVWIWARFNRALAKAALKDEKGLNAEFAAIPEPILAHIRKATGLTRPLDILEAGLRLSRGFRRDEYGQAIWMKGGR